MTQRLSLIGIYGLSIGAHRTDRRQPCSRKLTTADRPFCSTQDHKQSTGTIEPRLQRRSDSHGPQHQAATRPTAMPCGWILSGDTHLLVQTPYDPRAGPFHAGVGTPELARPTISQGSRHRSGLIPITAALPHFRNPPDNWTGADAKHPGQARSCGPGHGGSLGQFADLYGLSTGCATRKPRRPIRPACGADRNRTIAIKALILLAPAVGIEPTTR